eukprot:9403219-Heterocapsa_arctica.AAC.1
MGLTLQLEDAGTGLGDLVVQCHFGSRSVDRPPLMSGTDRELGDSVQSFVIVWCLRATRALHRVDDSRG